MDRTSEYRRWEHAAFWIGMTELADTQGAPADIREAILELGHRVRWQPINDGRPFYADHHAITQVYLWAARHGVGKEAIAPTIKLFDQVLAEQPRASLEETHHTNWVDRWTWCDALFMSPPAMIQLSQQTGDARYRERALHDWWETTDFLYDPAERLYFRDLRFFEQRDEQGNKVFWSRGNAWVFAAMARLLPLLDTDNLDARRMRELFTTMAERLIELQKEDGYWSPSLLSPQNSPPETSGTGFFTYGLAWGINAGLLKRERFEPAVRKGWAALQRAIQPDGKLGYVQQVSDRPDLVDKDDTHYYGTGALLMAASEITRMDDIAKP